MAPDRPACPHCGRTDSLVEGLCAACCAGGLEGALDSLLGDTFPAAPDDALPSLPGYTIHRTVGVGGMGQVFAATREADGTEAAVKVLAVRWAADPEAIARFDAEAKALRGLDHPGIVRLHETGETDEGRHFIATELVHGCDLASLLRAEQLDPARAFQIFGKVCAALAHAHDRGIVHRDVKPSNILIGRDGSVKLADFGLARELTDAHSHYGITQTRDTFGTPYYVAPEVLQRRSSGSPAVDVYAAAVLFYHLLTGSPPLGNYTPLSAVAGLPRRADAILAAALQADPDKRTATIDEFARGVAQVHREWLASHDRRRAWRRFGASVAGLAALAGAASLGAWWRGRSSLPPPPPVFDDPTAATVLSPWKNSLGMLFVPAGGEKRLFAIHETRRRDFDPFFAADRAPVPEWRMIAGERSRRFQRMQTLTDAGWTDSAATWKEPGFSQSPDHPVVGITLADAQSFCVWLTLKERREGRLSPTQLYRLPTDTEWSLAAGLSAEAGRSPRARSDALTPAPPQPPGNTAGEEARIDGWPTAWQVPARRDPFSRTAPVGSFPPLANGLHDMGGNVSEWVSTVYARNMTTNTGQPACTLRGASWATTESAELRPDHRRPVRRMRAAADTGFRIVLDLNAAADDPAPTDDGDER